MATVLALAGAALFVRLGLWQVHRAEEKQALLDQYAAGQAVVDLTSATPQPPALETLPRYQQVRVRGHYAGARQILLDNMPAPQGGWPGYRVLTPFELERGGWLLVDRGWVPIGRTRAELPDLVVGEDARTIVGRLDTLPRAGLQLEQPADTNATWPKVMSFPPQAALEGALGRKLVPGRLVLDPDQGDGYQRIAQAPVAFGPGRHIGYAVQWFALAAAVAVIYIVTALKPARPRPNPPG
jgi:surfeit locus 1 family protein